MPYGKWSSLKMFDKYCKRGKLIIILAAWFILIGYGISLNKHNDPFEQEQTLAFSGIGSR